MESKFWKDKKTLITGHTGFKGSWLVLYLDALGADLYGYALEPETRPSFYQEANLDNLMAKNAMSKNIAGLESLIGVPGTLGGALIMNAGAYGSEISKYFISAETMNLNGKTNIFTNKTIDFSYRTSTFPDNEILIILQNNLGS